MDKWHVVITVQCPFDDGFVAKTWADTMPHSVPNQVAAYHRAMTEVIKLIESENESGGMIPDTSNPVVLHFSCIELSYR